MKSDNELGGSVGLDTTSFKKGVSELNSQIKSIETSFRASAAVMGSWGENSDGLKMRIDSLNQKLELQKKKLKILNDEYDKAVNAQNKDEKSIQSLASQMYSAEKAISSTERQVKKYNKQLEDCNDPTKGLTDTLGKLDREIAVSEGEFKVAASGMKNWRTSSEGLSAKLKSLNQVATLQKQKIDSLTATYSQVAQQKGESSKAAQDLSIKINKEKEAFNKTESEIKKYKTELDNARAGTKKMTEEAEKSSKKLEKLSGNFKKVGDKAQSIGSSMTHKVTAPIAAAGIASLKTASDLNESLDKSDCAFKGSSSSIKKWSESTLEKFGLAQGTALEMSTAYGDMATSMGYTTGEAAKLSKQLVGRAADLSAYKNISIDVANTALTGVFTGETESLKKLGVVMTQANIEQYLLANGCQTAYKEMSQQEQVQWRVKYVMDATKNAAGNFSKTNGEAAGQARIFKEGLKQLGETFGQEMLPSVTSAIGSLNNLIKSFGKLDDGTKKTIITLAGVSAATGPIINGFGKTASTVGGAIEAFKKFKDKANAAKIAQASVATATKKTSGAVKVFGTVLKALKGPIGIAIAALGALAIAYKKTHDKIEEEKKANIDKKYDYLIEKNSAEYQNNISNLEKEKNALSNSLNKQLNDINSYYDKKSKAAENYEKQTKKALEEENKAYEEAHKKRIKELEDEQKKRKEAIDRATGKATSELQAKIDAIDAKTAAEEKAIKEKENKEKLAALRDQLRLAKTNEDRKEAQKNLDEFLSQLARKKLLEHREIQKKALKDQINNLKKEATEKKKQVDKDIQNQKRAADAKLKVEQASVNARIKALDGYAKRQKKILERSKNNAIKTARERADGEIAQIDRQISKYQELQSQMQEDLDKARELKKETVDVGASDVFGHWRDNISTIWDRMVLSDNYKPGGKRARAIGDNNWQGGPVRVHEEGGEILNLPKHTQIIPHDVSMEMARTYAKQAGKATKPNQIINNNNYAPAMQSLTLQVESEKVATVVTPTVSYNMAQSHLGVKGACGYGY